MLKESVCIWKMDEEVNIWLQETAVSGVGQDEDKGGCKWLWVFAA